MPLLKEIADRLSNNVLIQGVLEEIITEDELFGLLDFRQVNGKSLTYNRELALPQADFLAPNDNVNESAGTVEEITTMLRAIIGDVDVDSFVQETESDTNDQQALQVAMKVKTVARKFRDTLVNGGAYSATLTGAPAGFITAIEVSDPNGKGVGTLNLTVGTNTLTYQAPGDDAPGDPVVYAADGKYVVKSKQPSKYVVLTLVVASEGAGNLAIGVNITETKQFTGLKSLVTPAQTIDAGVNGAAVSWDLLDQLADKVKAGTIAAYLMNERTIRSYKALLRAAGGVDSAMLQLPNFGRPVLTLNGVPVLKNNYISTTETQGASNTCTSIYAIHMGPAGLQGLYGGSEAGIRIEPVGIVQNKDAQRTRVKWYCGLAMYSTLSLARLRGINN